MQTPDLGTTPLLEIYTLPRSNIAPPIAPSTFTIVPLQDTSTFLSRPRPSLLPPIRSSRNFTFGTLDYLTQTTSLTGISSAHFRHASSTAPGLVLLPGPGDRRHSQPTPPDSTTPISQPTTPPQAFQPPPTVPPPSALPAAEAEELRQLRLQFQQQAAHQLQQQKRSFAFIMALKSVDVFRYFSDQLNYLRLVVVIIDATLWPSRRLLT